MRIYTPLLFIGLLLSTGCGSDPETPAPEPVEAPEPEGPTLPKMDCPEGSNYVETELDGTYEQSCEIGGAKTGPFRRWHTLEIKAVDGRYTQGMPDATWIWTYKDGSKKSKGSYRKGKEAGSWTWWYPGGQKSEEGDFLSGRKAGHWNRWHESGKIMEEGLYHNGTKNGEWKYYRDDATNTVHSTQNWQMGKMKDEKYLDEKGKSTSKPK